MHEKSDPSLNPKPAAAYLIVKDSHGERVVHLASGNAWTLGRSDKNTIVINENQISRNHALIQRMGERGDYYLIDTGSRNGSFLKGRRITTPAVIHDGDEFVLGNTQILFWNPAQRPARDDQTPEPSGRGPTIMAVSEARVSVLVVDIRDFSGLARRVEEAVLSQLVGFWFSEADRIMQNYGSATQKYIGDAVMTVWVHTSRGQERLEILRILRGLCEFADSTGQIEKRFGLGEPFRIGAGLNTGLAAVGNTGTRQMTDFTAMGESVNAAFRLETATKDLQTDVVLGQTTYQYLQLLPMAPKCFHSAEVKLKGYEDPAQIWYASFAQLRSFLDRMENESLLATVGRV